MGSLIGVDGCRHGWIAVSWHLDTQAVDILFVARLRELLALPGVLRIGIDMPVGLPEQAEPGGRACDRLARRHSGRPSSIFSPPVRSALEASSYVEACRRQRASSRHRLGLSKQGYLLFAKMREVDALVTPALQDNILFEVHPELSFAILNGGPLHHGKKTLQGRREREALLAREGFPPVAELRKGFREAHVPRDAALAQVQPDDIADACVACWSARRIHRGEAQRFPAEPGVDRRGLKMEIWC